MNLPESDRIDAFNTVQAVVIEQPHKIPLLAGAIQIANGMESSIGKLCVESFHSRIQEAIEKGNWNSVKLLTRFVAALYPMLADNGGGLFKLLNALLDKSIELQKASEKRSPLGQELYTASLLALPCLISSVTISDAPELLTQSIKDFIIKSREFPILEDAKALNILKPWTGQNLPYENRNFVPILRSVMDSLVENNLAIPSMLDISSLIESEMPKDGHFVPHAFSALNIPENIKDLAPYKGIDYKTERLFFSAYLPDILATVPPVETLESVMFRDISTDVINNMDFNRKEVARQLITLDLFFDKRTFTEPGISMDRLQALHADSPKESTWKVEDVAMEAVLEGIFKLPCSAFYGSYFHAILIEACIMAPQAIAPVFGRAIRFLYSHLDQMDVELHHRFLDWFSHHLSNFGFSWKWQEWKDDIGLPDLHPRKVFIKQLIEKEVRLSYAQRVKETLPEELIQYVKAAPEEPIFKFLEPESRYQTEVHKLVSLLREGNEKEDIDSLLKEISEKANSLEGESQEALKIVIDIAVSTTCYLGNRSISHAESWIARCKDMLLDVCPNDYNKTIESVLEYWKEQPYVALLVVFQLIKQGILPPSAYVKSFQEPFSRDLLTTNHGWEMLNRVLDFTVAHSVHGQAANKAQIFSELLNVFATLISVQEQDASEEAMEVEEEEAVRSPETKRWAVWWTKGTIRSLIRKYYEVFQSNPGLGAGISDDHIATLVEQARAL